MIPHDTNDMLFDDVSVLTKLSGKNELFRIKVSNDCDCDGYNSTSTKDDFDTTQIAQSFGQTN